MTVATEDDKAKLDRLMKYLNGSKELMMFFNAKSDVAVEDFIDASFCVHADGHSQSKNQRPRAALRARLLPLKSWGAGNFCSTRATS